MSQKHLYEFPDLIRVIIIFRTSLTQLAFFTPPAIHSSSYNVAKGHVKVRVWSVESITVIPSRPVMYISESVRFHYLTQIN